MNEYPCRAKGWSGNQFGDIWLGGKFNLSSQFDQKPVAFALRALLKMPTAKDDEEGVGTGKTDFAFDGIVSKEINERVEVSGFGGLIFRGSPDAVEMSNGFRYGFGLGCRVRKGSPPHRGAPRRSLFDDTVTLHLAPEQHSFVGEDRSLPPLTTASSSPFTASIGLTWQGKRGCSRARGSTGPWGSTGAGSSGRPSKT